MVCPLATSLKHTSTDDLMGDDAKKIEAIKRVPIMAEHYST